MEGVRTQRVIGKIQKTVNGGTGIDRRKISKQSLGLYQSLTEVGTTPPNIFVILHEPTAR